MFFDLKFLAFLSFATLFAVCALCSCQSTKSRIEKNPELFLSLTPEQQLQVQSGTIEPGYTKAMVHLSQGKPDRIEEEQVGTVRIERWIYKKPRLVQTPGAGVGTPPGFHGAYGAPQFGPGPSRPAGAMFYSSSSMVVEFQDGVVLRVVQH